MEYSTLIGVKKVCHKWKKLNQVEWEAAIKAEKKILVVQDINYKFHVEDLPDDWKMYAKILCKEPLVYSAAMLHDCINKIIENIAQ